MFYNKKALWFGFQKFPYISVFNIFLPIEKQLSQCFCGIILNFAYRKTTFIFIQNFILFNSILVYFYFNFFILFLFAFQPFDVFIYVILINFFFAFTVNLWLKCANFTRQKTSEIVFQSKGIIRQVQKCEWKRELNS